MRAAWRLQAREQVRPLPTREMRYSRATAGRSDRSTEHRNAGLRQRGQRLAGCRSVSCVSWQGRGARVPCLGRPPWSWSGRRDMRSETGKKRWATPDLPIALRAPKGPLPAPAQAQPRRSLGSRAKVRRHVTGTSSGQRHRRPLQASVRVRYSQGPAGRSSPKRRAAGRRTELPRRARCLWPALPALRLLLRSSVSPSAGRRVACWCLPGIPA